MSERLSVYVVDDHPVVRAGLRALLSDQADIDVVGEQGTAAGANEEIRRLRPRVVVSDIHLPDGSGLEVCRAAKLQDPAPAVILLSAFSNDQLVEGAFAAGADGYLLKRADGLDIVAAVRSVARGERVVDPELLPALLPTREGPGRPATPRLTDRDRELLGLIARGHTNALIARELFLSPHTVKEYVSRLLEKLAVSNRTELIARAAELGLIDSAQPTATRPNPPIGG